MNNEHDLSDLDEAIELCLANVGRNSALDDTEIDRILESIGEIDGSELSEGADICACSITSTSDGIGEVSSEPNPIPAVAQETDSQADPAPTYSNRSGWRKGNPKRDPWCFGRPGYVDLNSATCSACRSASKCKEEAASTEEQRFERMTARVIRENQPALASGEVDLADLTKKVSLTIERNRASALPVLHSLRDSFAAGVLLKSTCDASGRSDDRSVTSGRTSALSS